jgi:putrescine transport system substrate-binding protein
MRTILKSGLVAIAVVAGLSACGKKEEAAPTAAAEEKVLNVYNWSDYIAEETVPEFQAKSGIQVNYDVFDSNEVLETKLLAGRTGYDVVVPSASFLERQIKAGVFMKLDKSKLPNLANMDPEIMERVGKHDPGNEYAVPYLWGTTGIGYNPEKVKAALGVDTIDSWAMIFDPENAKKLQSCGLTLLDAPGEVIDSALIFLGRDPNSETPEDLAAAEELLMKIRPFVRYLHSSQYIDDLANGEICVALGWSGDILQAQARGAEAATPVEVAYAIPKEGAIMWFDMLAIPADAPHPNNAHRIHQLPDGACGHCRRQRLCRLRECQCGLVRDDRRGGAHDPSVYPSPEVKAKLYPHLAESQEYSRLSTRAWTRFKTGQ